jgi:hypothetical protein
MPPIPRNILRDPEEWDDPFLLDPIDLTTMEPTMPGLVPPFSVLFSTASSNKEEEEAEDLLTTEMDLEETLATKSPMAQIFRILSPFPKLTTLSLWEPSHKSSTETEPELTHSLQNTLDT